MAKAAVAETGGAYDPLTAHVEGTGPLPHTKPEKPARVVPVKSQVAAMEEVNRALSEKFLKQQGITVNKP